MKTFLLNKFVLIAIHFCFSNIYAQDLEPRFLSSVPFLGTNFTGLIYGYSSGNILLDNSLPIEDLNAKINIIGAVYARSFKLFNKPAKFDIVLPYSFGSFNALVEDEEASTSRNGFGDPSLRVSIILIGEDALGLKEFAKREKKKFKFGTAFKIRAPFSQYDNTKLINLGANRWAFLLKAAASYDVSKKIIFEAHINSWFFTKNKSFYEENIVQQKPLFSVQFHAAYIFNPKIWVSASIGRVAFGETIINDIDKKMNKKIQDMTLHFLIA